MSRVSALTDFFKPIFAAGTLSLQGTPCVTRASGLIIREERAGLPFPSSLNPLEFFGLGFDFFKYGLMSSAAPSHPARINPMPLFLLFKLMST